MGSAVANRLRSSAVSVLLGLVLWALPRGSEARPHRHAQGAAAPTVPTYSMGFPNHGYLVNGHRIESSSAVRYLPGRVLHWGTDELVELLERVGHAMYARFRVPLTVGDLSARRGGPVDRHRSHQSGRDVDVAFFVRSSGARGVPVQLDDYVRFDGRGRSYDGAYVFDTARNWALVRVLLGDPHAHVERIFVSTPLRALLLRHAVASGAPGATVDQAARTLAQPARVSPHDNHFHVRIGCPRGDRACHAGVFNFTPTRRRVVRAAARARSRR